MDVISNLLSNRKTGNWVIAGMAVVILILIGWGISSASGGNTAAPTEATVTGLTAAETIQATGSLEAQPFASLTWKTNGLVESVNVKAGDLVKAGDIMVSLQPSSTSTDIAGAQADLVETQKELEDLLNSSGELAQATIDLKEAQEEYDKKLYYVNYLNDPTNTSFVDTNLYMEQTRQGGYVYRYSVREYREPTASTLAEANNNLALAEGELYDAQHTYDLLKAGANSPDVLAAQAKVEAAQATVNHLSIIAPFDGQVLSVDSYVGDLVRAGDLSINLADMDHLYLQAKVDEVDIAQIKLGNPAEATLDAVPGVTLHGEVTAINPVGVVDSGLVKYTVRVDLEKVGQEILLPLGTTANVVIQTKEALPILVVPLTAIQRDDQGEYVLVIEGDHSTRRVDVVGGEVAGDLIAVTGDLKVGDRVQLLPDASAAEGN
jgi:RND family efflux transporter MFP subunit